MLNESASGSDLDEATAIFSDEYRIPNFASAPSEAEFSWAHTVRGDDVMTFRTSTFMANLAGVPEANDDFIIWWNRAGRSVLGSDRSEVRVKTGSPFLLSRDRPTAVQHFDVTHDLVHIHHTFVEQIARETSDKYAGFVSFQSGGPSTAQAQTVWLQTVNYVAGLWLPDPASLSPILRQELAHLMTVVLLNSFPLVVNDVQLAVVGVDSAKVRAAVEFAHSNAHLSISGTDIAAAAGLSTRALQHSLRRQLDTTPSGLLRSIRLDRVHQELTHPGMEEMLVLDVARRWGFVHLGRFAKHYFARYNELPSQTLRQGSRRQA